MRRVGDRTAAVQSRRTRRGRFRSRQRDISDLINKPHTTESRLAVREMYEARTPTMTTSSLVQAAGSRPAGGSRRAARRGRLGAPAEAAGAVAAGADAAAGVDTHAAAESPSTRPRRERPAAAPQPKKPSPAPRPRTPPLEAFRKHAGPDGDRKAAVAAFFAAQSSDEAPPPKKARTDDAIGDGEVLSEMF